MNTSLKNSLLAAAAFAAATCFAQTPPSVGTDSTPPPQVPPPAPGTPDSPDLYPSGKTPVSSGVSQAPVNDQYATVDSDLDGRISLNEFTSAAVLNGGASVTTRSAASGIPRSDETTGDAKGRNTPEVFRQFDVNKDGYLSSAEFAAYTQAEKR
jgi:hypothetical protein